MDLTQDNPQASMLAPGADPAAMTAEQLAAALTDQAVAAREADKTEKQTRKRAPVRVRILVDGPHGQVNQVVELPADIAKALQADGAVDASPEAVAYADSLAA